MMRFEKRKQRKEETIDKLADELKSQPDELNSKIYIAVVSEFFDSLKSDELRTMLATH